MSTSIKVTALQQRDLFELPNGSVYETARRGAKDEPVQAQLWCAHEPDAPTGAPKPMTFPLEQTVALLSHAESRLHVRHPGYARTVFEQTMEAHHQQQMNRVYETINREDVALRQQTHAGRSWWRKLFR
jgi:hypothetical protein